MGKPTGLEHLTIFDAGLNLLYRTGGDLTTYMIANMIIALAFWTGETGEDERESYAQALNDVQSDFRDLPTIPLTGFAEELKDGVISNCSCPAGICGPMPGFNYLLPEERQMEAEHMIDYARVLRASRTPEDRELRLYLSEAFYVLVALWMLGEGYMPPERCPLWSEMRELRQAFRLGKQREAAFSKARIIYDASLQKLAQPTTSAAS